MMIREVEHVELKVLHFRESWNGNGTFLTIMMTIIQQEKVTYTLNLAEWQTLSIHMFYAKIKSFYNTL